MPQRLRVLRLAIVADAEMERDFRANRGMGSTSVRVRRMENCQPVVKLAQLEQRRAFKHARRQGFVRWLDANVQPAYRVESAVSSIERNECTRSQQVGFDAAFGQRVADREAVFECTAEECFTGG